jgi:hypothetical protein
MERTEEVSIDSGLFAVWVDYYSYLHIFSNQFLFVLEHLGSRRA